MNKFDLNKASIFERTMCACLEAKRTNASKTVTESNKAVVKKTAKAVNESVKRHHRGIFESDDLDDAEADLYADDVISDEEVMDDVIDDVVVVVDPELDSEEVDEFVDELQDIVDSTPEGEVPTIDDYADDFTYTCPICGNTFFSDNEMSAGDACPVCGDTPTNFVLVGSVASPDDTIADEEEEVIDEPVEDEPIEDVPVDEPVDPEEDEVIDEPVEDEELEPVDPVEDEEEVSEESLNKTPSYKYSLDESTFNPYLTKFIRENYKNAKSFVITGAKRSGKALTIECKITFNSGKTKTFEMKSNNFIPAPSMNFTMRDSGVFKSESNKNDPFTFSAKMENRVMKCTGMRYNFTTVTEGTRVRISGNLVESKKVNFQKGKRA